MPNDPCSGRTAPLTSKHLILYIYSTYTGTEYFKHGILLHSPHTPDSSVVSAGVTNSLCVSPGQILRDVAERSDG